MQLQLHKTKYLGQPKLQKKSKVVFPAIQGIIRARKSCPGFQDEQIKSAIYSTILRFNFPFLTNCQQ